MRGKRSGRNKKINWTFFILIVSIIVTCSMAGVSYALINAQTKEVENDFNPKKYTDVEIKEPNGNKYIVNIDGTLDKEKCASFENPDNNTKDECIRARIIPIVREEDGSNAAIQPEIKVSFNNDDNWVKKDDYYYYKKVVSPGESTSNLFNNVAVEKETLGLLSKGQYIEINVIVDSVETSLDTDNNYNVSKVLEAWGVNPLKL